MRSMTSPRALAGRWPVGPIEHLTENCLAPRELALDGVHADTANARQLSMGQPVYVAQRQQDAGLPRYALQRAREVHRFHVEPRHRPRRHTALGMLGANAPPPQLVE